MSFPLSVSPPAPLSGQESGLAGDVPARIASLHVCPVKSCAGLAPAQARLHATGLALDRAWVVTDAAGGFVTQRTRPRMALVQAGASTLTLRAPPPAAPTVPIS